MSKKKRDDSYFAADRRRKKKSMMIIVPVIIAVAAASVAGAVLYQPVQVAAISGVECNRTEQFNYHVHTHLDVFVDGREQQVPDNVGRLDSCLYWLHTHTGDGIIHIEAPQTREFTLGQVIDVWKQTSDLAGFFDSVTDKNVTVYVDGEQVQGSYAVVPLKSLGEIVIVYGEPPEDIPAEFDFGDIPS